MAKLIPNSWKNSRGDDKTPVIVALDNGHILLTTDADTDADGSPDALEIDPGNGSAETSLRTSTGWKGKTKFVNARSVPYYVLPGNWKSVTRAACGLGDIARITYKDRSIYAIFADVGPLKYVGEASIATVEALGFNPWNRNSTRITKGIPFGVSYEIIPGSANLDVTVSFESIQSYGRQLFEGIPETIPTGLHESISTIKIDQTEDGSAVLFACNATGPVFSRHASSKSDVIQFLNAFPNAELVPRVESILFSEYPDLADIREFAFGLNPFSRFVTFFEANYAAVRKEVERWFVPKHSSSAVHNGCVAHQVSCLKLCDLPYPELGSLESINVDNFVDWAMSHGWTKIINRAGMQAGDICVSGPSSDPTELDHVFCFVKYIDNENAVVLHNQYPGLATRSLIGDGCGLWRFALRMPMNL